MTNEIQTHSEPVSRAFVIYRYSPRKPGRQRSLSKKLLAQRERSILFQVEDVEGGTWGVKQVRETKHGFDLLFGVPVDHGSYRGGLARIIATKELTDFWDANRTRHDGFLFDLPAGRSTLKRVRRRLQFNFRNDWSEFWMDRLEDLKTMPPRDFAAKHDLEPNVVFEMRFKLLGKRARDLGWWRDPLIVETLLSGVTLREIGEKLDIGTTHAKRLRDRARLEFQS
jgi:hypothetical protein